MKRSTTKQEQNLCGQDGGIVLDEFPGYIIFDCGEVYSLSRKRYLDKVMRRRNTQTIKSKYDYTINLKDRTVLLHRLLAKAFITNTHNKDTVNHIDGNPANVAISNLEWMTPSENSIHAHKLNLVGGRYTRIMVTKLVFKEVEVGRYSSLVEAAYSQGFTGTLRQAGHGISATIKHNKSIPSNTGEAYKTHEIVWREYHPEECNMVGTVAFVPNQLPVEDTISLPHPDNPAILVTEDGRMYNKVKERWLKPYKGVESRAGGIVSMYSIPIGKGKYKKVKTARVVARLFREDWPGIAFKDSNPLNCAADNLKPKRKGNGEKGCIGYRQEWKEVEVGMCSSVKEASKLYGCARSSIGGAININNKMTVSPKYSDNIRPRQLMGYIFRGFKD
jgi:hypothetical protein